MSDTGPNNTACALHDDVRRNYAVISETLREHETRISRVESNVESQSKVTDKLSDRLDEFDSHILNNSNEISAIKQDLKHLYIAIQNLDNITEELHKYKYSSAGYAALGGFVATAIGFIVMYLKG